MYIIVDVIALFAGHYKINPNTLVMGGGAFYKTNEDTTLGVILANRIRDYDIARPRMQAGRHVSTTTWSGSGILFVRTVWSNFRTLIQSAPTPVDAANGKRRSELAGDPHPTASSLASWFTSTPGSVSLANRLHPNSRCDFPLIYGSIFL